MDRLQTIRAHLAKAERHIREVEARINRQQAVARDLEQHGHIVLAAQAMELLQHLKQLQRLHFINHERWSTHLTELELGTQDTRSSVSSSSQAATNLSDAE